MKGFASMMNEKLLFFINWVYCLSCRVWLYMHTYAFEGDAQRFSEISLSWKGENAGKCLNGPQTVEPCFSITYSKSASLSSLT